jgi:hypothetical protein
MLPRAAAARSVMIERAIKVMLEKETTLFQPKMQTIHESAEVNGPLLGAKHPV